MDLGLLIRYILICVMGEELRWVKFVFVGYIFARSCWVEMTESCSSCLFACFVKGVSLFGYIFQVLWHWNNTDLYGGDGVGGGEYHMLEVSCFGRYLHT